MLQKWSGVPVRAGRLLIEESGSWKGGGEEVTYETAYQGVHLEMRAP